MGPVLFLRRKQINQGNDAGGKEGDNDHFIALMGVQPLLGIHQDAVNAVRKKERDDPEKVPPFDAPEVDPTAVQNNESRQHHGNSGHLQNGQVVSPINGGKEQAHDNAAKKHYDALERIGAGPGGVDHAKVIEEQDDAVDTSQQHGLFGGGYLKPNQEEGDGTYKDSIQHRVDRSRGSLRSPVMRGKELIEECLSCVARNTNHGNQNNQNRWHDTTSPSRIVFQYSTRPGVVSIRRIKTRVILLCASIEKVRTNYQFC